MLVFIIFQNVFQIKDALYDIALQKQINDTKFIICIPDSSIDTRKKKQFYKYILQKTVRKLKGITQTFRQEIYAYKSPVEKLRILFVN